MKYSSVLVDGRLLDGGGIGRHIVSSCRVLLDLGVRVGVVCSDAERVRTLLPGAEPILVRSGVYSPLEHIEIGRLFWRTRREWAVRWIPHYNAPLISPRPFIVTVHDLIHLRFRDSRWPWWRRLGARVILRRAVDSASRVICVSQATAGDLLAFRPHLSEKVVIVPNILSVFWSKKARDQSLLPGLPSGAFVLAVGNKKEHKNFSILLRAFERLSARFPDLALVLVGRREPAWLNEVEAWASAQPLQVKGRLFDVDSVSDEILRTLYSSAAVFAAPSLIEGFGLPPLEAMACECPVVASPIAAFSEVLGDAAHFVHGSAGADAWAEALALVIGDPGLASGLRIGGLQRAQLYREELVKPRLAAALTRTVETPVSRWRRLSKEETDPARGS